MTQRSWSLWSVLLCAFLLLWLLGAIPIAAQEVVVTPAAEESVIANLGTIVIAFLLAFAAGGLTVGASLMVFVNRLRNDKVLANAVERLYMSIPADKQFTIRQIVVGAQEGFDLAEDLTDGDLNTPVATGVARSPGAPMAAPPTIYPAAQG